jgi:hypothetical protein
MNSEGLKFTIYRILLNLDSTCVVYEGDQSLIKYFSQHPFFLNDSGSSLHRVMKLESYSTVCKNLTLMNLYFQSYPIH